MFKKSMLAMGCALAVMSGSASAALIYNEAVSGDAGPWFLNGGLALGDVYSGDYVLGRMDNTAYDSYWEGYNFYLDGSIRSVNITVLTGPASNNWQLYSGAGWGATLQQGPLNSFNSSLSFNVAGLSGFYTLGNNGVVSSMPYNYQIAFDTATDGADIPEPGTLALLGLGLAGFCARRRRKA
ncbi:MULTISPECIES: PEP-CTERM sorting domain-containing protein [unclassified Massilia]|uniref:PEP-CTERM sorting domain-containing protein n=1 Tax=unclassified Massilia TaxID=2609279 RepID=UPI001E4C8439|nr:MULTISPECIES: PEP-CTERM sorting domain-containing protein [unclassified Massilia]